jgi:hypothetical protein
MAPPPGVRPMRCGDTLSVHAEGDLIVPPGEGDLLARITARDQVSAVDEEVCSGCVEATRERGRLFFADFGSATALFPLSAVTGFEAERDLRLLVGVPSATASLATSADFDAARDRLRAGVVWEP